MTWRNKKTRCSGNWTQREWKGNIFLACHWENDFCAIPKTFHKRYYFCLKSGCKWKVSLNPSSLFKTKKEKKDVTSWCVQDESLRSHWQVSWQINLLSKCSFLPAFVLLLLWQCTNHFWNKPKDSGMLLQCTASSAEIMISESINYTRRFLCVFWHNFRRNWRWRFQTACQLKRAVKYMSTTPWFKL